MTKDKNSKRDRILDAAYTLLVTQGYWDTKIIDIADAAGIGKGTVYEYFASKDVLFLELFQSRIAAPFSHMSHILEKGIASAEKLREYLDIELKMMAQFNFGNNFLMNLVMNTDALRNSALIEAIHKLISDNFKILYTIIKDGMDKGEFRKIDPMMAAMSVMGALNFYFSIRHLPCTPDGFQMDQGMKDWNTEEILDIVLNGLTPI